MSEDAKPAEAAKKVKLVPMVRDPEQFPEGPHAADVHPDEVENYKPAGWTVK